MMLAGYGMYFLRYLLPRLPSRGRVLSISRMSLPWDLESLIQFLDDCEIPYDRGAVPYVGARRDRLTTAELFRLLGFAHYDDIDFDPAEGTTLLHDLNVSIPLDWHQGYDLVFENGTLEHIFDIKQAIGNIAHLVKVGGYVCHASPLDAFNHGFYNFSPNFFHDFYDANGFTDLHFYLVRYSSKYATHQSVHVDEIAYTHKEIYFDPSIYDGPLDKAYVGCLARKATHCPETRVPIQGAYDPRKRLPNRLKTH